MGHEKCVYEEVCVCVLCHVRLFTPPWTVAHQAPLSMGFPRQEHWSGLPFPSPEEINGRIKNICPIQKEAGKEQLKKKNQGTEILQVLQHDQNFKKVKEIQHKEPIIT